MNLFRNTKQLNDNNEPVINSLDLPWQPISIISSNCPKHIGVRLKHVGDNLYQCPQDKAIYKSGGSISNQTNRDNFYLGIVVK